MNAAFPVNKRHMKKDQRDWVYYMGMTGEDGSGSVIIQQNYLLPAKQHTNVRRFNDTDH